VLSCWAGAPAAVLRLPGDGRVTRGSAAMLQCRQSVSDEQTRQRSSIVWYRRRGDVRHQLAVHDWLNAELGTTGRRGRARVSVTHDTVDDALVSNLTIAGKLHDRFHSSDAP